MDVADRHAIFKTGIKEIAVKHGLMATFMAKPFIDDVGSSCHIHVSLCDASNDKPICWSAEAPHHMSGIMAQFLAGSLATSRDLATFTRLCRSIIGMARVRHTVPLYPSRPSCAGIPPEPTGEPQSLSPGNPSAMKRGGSAPSPRSGITQGCYRCQVVHQVRGHTHPQSCVPKRI